MRIIIGFILHFALLRAPLGCATSKTSPNNQQAHPANAQSTEQSAENNALGDTVQEIALIEAARDGALAQRAPKERLFLENQRLSARPQLFQIPQDRLVERRRTADIKWLVKVRYNFSQKLFIYKPIQKDMPVARLVGQYA